MERLECDSLSRSVLGAAFAVHNALGPGLLESAYKVAMCVELRHRGPSFERQKMFPLIYRGERVGDYFADLVVEAKIILELKAVKALVWRRYARLPTDVTLRVVVRVFLAPQNSAIREKEMRTTSDDASHGGR